MRRWRDRLLARGIARGDATAAELFVRGHYTAVFRLLRSLAGEQAAEDLTQATFVRALERIETYQGRASLRAWLGGIAYHEWCHQCRDARETVDLDDAPPPLDPRANGEAAVWLRWALARLSADHRAAFLLHHLHGLSVVELAELAEVPEGTVKSRLYHARKQLRAMLGEEDEGDAQED